MLLLDEPLGALDRKLRQEMQIELKLLQSQVGITFIFVTHDQEEALSMSDRIVVMLDGHVEQAADPDTIYDQPASAFVAGFIGQQNFLPGTVKGDGHELAGEGFTVIAGRAAPDATPGSPGIAAVRPEAVSLALDMPDQSVNAVKGKLAGVSHLGDLIQYVVITASGREMLSRQPRHEAPRLDLGVEVWCRWDADRVQVFGGDQSHRRHARTPRPSDEADQSTRRSFVPDDQIRILAPPASCPSPGKGSDATTPAEHGCSGTRGPGASRPACSPRAVATTAAAAPGARAGPVGLGRRQR